MGWLSKVGTFFKNEWNELKVTSDQALSEASDYFGKHGFIGGITRPVKNLIGDNNKIEVQREQYAFEANQYLSQITPSPNNPTPIIFTKDKFLKKLIDEAEKQKSSAIKSLKALAKIGDEAAVKSLISAAEVNPEGVLALEELAKTETNTPFHLYFNDALANLNVDKLSKLSREQYTQFGLGCYDSAKKPEFKNLTAIKALIVLANNENTKAKQTLLEYDISKLLEVANSYQTTSHNKFIENQEARHQACNVIYQSGYPYGYPSNTDTKEFFSKGLSRHHAIAALVELASAGHKQAQASLKTISLHPLFDSFYDVAVTNEWKRLTIDTFYTLVKAGHPEAFPMLLQLADVEYGMVSVALMDLERDGYKGAQKALENLSPPTTTADETLKYLNKIVWDRKLSLIPSIPSSFNKNYKNDFIFGYDQPSLFKIEITPNNPSKISDPTSDMPINELRLNQEKRIKNFLTIIKGLEKNEFTKPLPSPQAKPPKANKRPKDREVDTTKW